MTRCWCRLRLRGAAEPDDAGAASDHRQGRRRRERAPRASHKRKTRAGRSAHDMLRVYESVTGRAAQFGSANRSARVPGPRERARRLPEGGDEGCASGGGGGGGGGQVSMFDEYDDNDGPDVGVSRRVRPLRVVVVVGGCLSSRRRILFTAGGGLFACTLAFRI